MSEQYVTNSIIIEANAERIWDVLTNPSETKKYMFGCETVSDWKVGSELLWRAFYEGQDTVFVKGTVLQIDAPKLLEYSVIDPNSGIADLPENYVNVTYALEPAENKTVLTVKQGDFSKVADGQRRYEETLNNGEGWNPLLVQIKAIAEEIDATE
ncbi:MAG: SRPBCC domain-containing protein [Chitinophagaceae bacterium]